MQALFLGRLFLKINAYVFLLIMGTLNASDDFKDLNAAQQRVRAMGYKKLVDELAGLLGESPRVTGIDFSPAKARVTGIQYKNEFIRLKKLAEDRGTVLGPEFDMPTPVASAKPLVVSVVPGAAKSTNSTMSSDGLSSSGGYIAAATVDHIDSTRAIPSLVTPS